MVLNEINLPDSVANLYFRPPSPDLQTLLYTTQNCPPGDRTINPLSRRGGHVDSEWRTLGPRQLGAEVSDAREVQGIFGLLGRGWQLKAVARELVMARNTVRSWVRGGPDS